MAENLYEKIVCCISILTPNVNVAPRKTVPGSAGVAAAAAVAVAVAATATAVAAAVVVAVEVAVKKQQQ